MPSSHQHSGRQRIIDAFSELLALHPDGDITVKEICSAAGICRSTFYNNFRNIEDVLDVSMDQFIESYESLATSLGEYCKDGYDSFEASMVPFRDFLYENRILLSALLNSERGGDFRIRIADAMGNYFAISGIVPKDRDDTDAILTKREMQYAQSLVGYTWVAFLECWSMSSFRESPEEFFRTCFRIQKLDLLPVR